MDDRTGTRLENAQHRGGFRTERGSSLVAGMLLLLGLVCSDGSWGWGADGHRLIADYALTRLSPSARTEVDRLLALEPGAPLASVSPSVKIDVAGRRPR